MKAFSGGPHGGLRRLSILGTAILLLAAGAFLLLTRRSAEVASPEPRRSEYSRTEAEVRPSAAASSARSARVESKPEVDPLEGSRVLPPAPKSVVPKSPSLALASPIAAEGGAGPARYSVHDRNVKAFFTDRGVTLAIVTFNPRDGAARHDLRWGVNGAAAVQPRPEGELPGRVNRLVGDSANWQSNQATYSKVDYAAVQPGVDVSFESRNHALKYTVQLAAGADPEALNFEYEGADDLQVSADGSALEVQTSVGILTESELACWQDGPGGRVPVSARYVRRGPSTYAIRLGGHDPKLPVTVDPTISWATFIGGEKSPTGGDDQAFGIATDGGLNVYITGYTSCVNFPTTVGVVQGKHSILQDGFVAKFSTVGTLLWATYLGGNSEDSPRAIKVDSSGSPIIGGYTFSTDFPVTAGSFGDVRPGTGQMGFVTKLDSSAGVIVWSGYLGGNGDTQLFDVALDPSNSEVVAVGYTYATNFSPAGGPFQPANGGSQDAFICKIKSTGTGLVYSSYLGGVSNDIANCVTVDSSGQAYVAGYTTGTFPTTFGVHRTTPAGLDDCFVAKIDTGGGTKLWATLVGGASADRAYGICLDTSLPPAVYITGNSNKSTTLDYPVTFGPVHNSLYDAFVTKLNSNGTGLIWSTNLGGSGSDYGYGISSYSGNGDVYVAGYSNSNDFVMTGTAFKGVNSGNNDGWMARLSSGGTTMYSTFLGGSSTDYIYATTQNLGWVWVAGLTSSTDFNVTPGVYSTTLSGPSDAFVARFNPYLTNASSLMFSTYLGGANGQGNQYIYSLRNAVATDSGGSAYILSYVNTIDYPTSPGAYHSTLNGTVSDYAVTKLSPSGALAWSTYVGSSSDDTPSGIAVNSSGEAYVIGYTSAIDYPVTVGAYRTLFSAPQDSFVTRIRADGTGLVWSTFLGGSSNYDYAYGIALDPSNNVYVTGEAYSTNFPTTAGVVKPSNAAFSDGFVTKINSTGTGLIWSTYLGGNNSYDFGYAIAVDTNGSPYITGVTQSSNFITTAGAFNTAFDFANNETIFVTKLTPTATAYSYSTYLGGSAKETPSSIAVDPSGSAYVAGFTLSTDFPVLAGVQMLQAGGRDGFVTKFNPAGTALVWSTYLGGSNTDVLGSIALDGSQNVYVSGYTLSTNFPMTPPLLDSVPNGGYDAFATRINAVGNTLSWSTYIGGSNTDAAGGIAVSPQGQVVVGGYTYSLDFPVTGGALSTSLSGSSDLFLVRISNDPPTVPSGLAQYRSNGTTLIPVGGATNELTVILKGASSDPEGDKYKLQVEVRPIAVPLTSPAVVTLGADFFESGLVFSSTTATVTVTGRTPGVQYHWQVRSVDSAGVASAWTSYDVNAENPPTSPAANDFRVDQTSPGLSITSPTSSGTYNTNLGTVSLGGTASDNVQLFNVTWFNAGNSSSGTATGTASWSIPSITLVAGTNTITVTAQDTAGNTASQVISVVLDATAPTVTLTSPTSNPTLVIAGTTTTLGGTYSDNIGVTNLTWANTTNGLNGTASFSAGAFSVPAFALAIGINNISVTAFDAAGNSSSDTLALTSDPSAPLVTITSPTPATTFATSAASITLGGTASDSVTSVTLVQYINTTTTAPPPSSASGTTSWSTGAILLADGNNVINVIATDAAGNQSTDTITVIKDTAAPSVTINSPTVNPTSITSSSSIALGGTASDSGLSGLKDVKWVNAATGANGTASGTTSWSVAAIGLVSGANSITVTATDNANNPSTDNIVVTYDPTPPTVTITGPTSNPTLITPTSPITLTGTASDAGGGTISSMNWSTTGAVATTSGTVTYNPALGTWSIPAPQISLASGSQTITITAVDTAGNSAFDTIAVTLDTTNPAVAITTPSTNPFYTTLGTAALAGTASDTSGITQVQYRVNGGALITASGTTSWSVASVTLPATSNTIDVIATDGAGNSTQVSTTIIKDTTAPTISISTNGGLNFATSTTPLALAGISGDNFVVSSVQWQNNLGAFNSATGTTSWTASIPLVAGSNSIIVRATDGAGTQSAASITVTLDQTAPTVTITGPTASPTFSTTASTVSLTGTYSDAGGGSVVSVNWATTAAVAPASGATTLSAGTFTSTALINLQAGSQTITVTATDSAGNTSTDNIVITRDNTNPSVAISTPAANPFSTTASSVTLAGTASDNNALSIVEYRVLPSATFIAASGTTSWSVASAAVAAGSNTIEVRATDLAGNSTTVSTVVIRDNTLPTITITTFGGADTTTNATPLALAGTASDNNTVSSVAWSNNGSAFTAATGTTAWTASIPLSAGTNTIVVRALDAAGNQGNDTIIVTYDSGAPILTVTTPATTPFVTGGATISVVGTASDPSGVQKVEYRLVPAAFALAGGTPTNWSTPAIGLSAGSNTIEIRATDNGNNAVTVSITVIRDNTGPTVAITSPTASANYATSANTVSLGGTVSDTGGGTVASVTWNNPSATSSGTANIVGGTWTATAATSLVAGSQLITVTATDSVGNISTTTLTVFKDNTAPTIAISTPTSPNTRNTTPVAVTGTAADTGGSGVGSVSWFRAEGGGASGGASGTTSWTASVPLVLGTNTISFSATDAAGNSSTGAVLSVTLDQTAPSLQITGPTSSSTYATNAASISLSGTVSDAGGGTITTVDWQNTTNATSGGTTITAGNWTALGATTLAAGTNSITVTAFDSAGNSTVKTLTVTKDNTPPTVAISTPADNAVVGSTPVTVTGTAADPGGSGVASISWSRAEGGGASGSASGTTAWSASVPLVAGVNTITFTGTDAAGNPSAGTVVHVQLDQTGPTIAITTPATAPFYTSATSIQLLGTAVDVGGGTVSTVTWSNAGNATSGGTSFAAPNWTTIPAPPGAITLAPGVSQVITITATDSVGNVSIATLTVVQDATVPTVNITSPAAGGSSVVTGANPVSVGGSASDVGGSGIKTVTWANSQGPSSGTATGTTSWTTSIPLIAGPPNVITVTATDNAGNIKTDSITITLNALAPTVTITSPTSNPTFFTSASTLALAGTSIDSDGTIVSVSWSNSAGGSGSATGTFPGAVNTATPWSVAGIALAVGTNTITVTATDNGATTGNDTITVIRDNTDPAIAVTTNSGANFSTSTSPVSLSGTASDAGLSGLASVTWTNAATSGTGPAVGTSSWTGSVPLTPGANIITFTATDGAGNIKTAAITVTYDLTNPAVAITAPSASGTFQTAAPSLAIGALSGTASDANGITLVQYQLNGGAFITATGTTSWSNPALISLAGGVNTIVVKATDGSGNTTTTSLSVTRDSTVPSITISSPATGLVTNASPITLSGIASDNLALFSITWTNTLTAGSGTATGTTSWTATGVTLAAGVNPITVRATDTLGNFTNTSISVTYDATVPTLNITTPATTTVITNLAQISLAGTSSDNISVASVTASNAANSSTGTPGGTPAAWTVSNINLIVGTNVITVTATDSAGNVTSKVLTVTRDTTAPAVAIVSPTSGPTYLASTTPLALSGTSSDNVAVASVTWVNSAGGSGTAAGTTSWSSSVALTAGTNTITVTATDTAGNTQTAVLTVTYDSTLPAVAITTPAGATFATNTSPVALAGTASDLQGIASVKWSNTATGGAGTATFTAPNWSSSVPLAIGVNAITVTATDGAGNTNTALVTVTLDTTIPTLNITGPTAAPTYVTSAASLALAGNTSDNISVASISWTTTGVVVPASGSVVPSAGTWSVPVINLAAGSQDITVTATDTAGNVSTDTITVTRDNTVPTLAITSPTASGTYVTSATTLIIGGTAADNVAVNGVAWSRLEGPPAASGAAAGTTSWSATVPLLAGTNTFSFQATDTAGNVSVVSTIVVTRDNTVPAVQITGPTPNPTFIVSASPVAISGTASDADGISSVTWANSATGGAGTATFAAPNWSSPVPLAIGVNTITVTATDSAGNTSTDTLDVTLDVSAPTVTINSPTSAVTALVSGTTLALGGTASDNIGLTSVTANNAANNSTGTPGGTPAAWTVSGITLVAGANVITVTATDTAGNTSTDVITVTSDGAPPAVQITGPTAQPTYTTNLNPLTVSGTASDNLAVASVAWSNSAGGSGAATGTAAWSASIPLTAGVTNTITITVTDTAGGTSTDQLAVTYDNAVPTIAISAPTGAATYDTNVAPLLLGGTASDVVGLQSVTWSNAGTGGSGAATGSASWSATVPLVNGLNLITVTATDTAGNTTTDTLTVTFDAVLPTVTINLPTNQPTFLTSAASIALAGTSADNVGVVSVACVNAANGVAGVVTGTASWTVAPLALVAGDNPITVTVTDSAGNTNTDTITITRDSAPPVVAFVLPTSASSALTSSSPLAIGGTASDNVGLLGITWSNPAVPASGSATGTTNWSAAVPISGAGVNTITVTATDLAGNIATTTLQVTLDTTAPTLSATGPTNQPTYSTATSSVTVSGTAADGNGLSTVTWTNSATGATGTATGTTTWSAAIALTPGLNVITITAVDGAGNMTSTILTVTHDTQSPTVTISTPTSAANFNSPSSPLTIGGGASDNVGVTIVTWTNAATGGSGTALGTTSWTASVPLVQGNNQIMVTAIDNVGNSASDTITVSYDPSLPTINIVTPSSGATYSTTSNPLDFTGSASDNLALASVDWSNLTTGTTGTAIGTTAWSASVSLTSGPNTIVFTATDGVGNTTSDTMVVTYDVTSPVVVILNPAPPTFTTQTRPLDISGTASDNVGVVNVTWSNSLTGSSGSATFADPNWSASIPLVPGINLITIRASDALGNIGSSTLSVDYSHETVVPTIQITTPTLLPTFTSLTQLVTVAGTASDNVGVTTVSWLNRATNVYGTAIGTTSWVANIPLASGSNLIQVTALDDVGNSMTAAITIDYTAVIEANPPTITITAPTTSDTFNTTVSPLHLEADAIDDSGVISVTWSNLGTFGTGDSGWGTFWYADIPLVSGVNVITVTAIDTSGNTATDTIIVTYNPPIGDPVPPVVSIVTPIAAGTVDVTVPVVSLAGTASDNNQVDSVTFANSATGVFATATGTTSWSAPGVALNAGVNVITARAVDPAGNIGQSTLVVVYTPPAAAKPVAPTIPAGMCGCTGLEVLLGLGALWLRRRRRSA